MKPTDSNCKTYCNCAEEAMESGASRDWVDGTQDNCPLKPKQEFKTVGAIDAGKFKNWADAGTSHKVPTQDSDFICGDEIIDGLSKCKVQCDACKPKEYPKQPTSIDECDMCEPVSGFYLGTTCPKCYRPFRAVKSQPTSIEEDVYTKEDFDKFCEWLDKNWRRAKTRKGSGWFHVGDFYKQDKPTKTRDLAKKWFEHVKSESK